LPVRVVFPTAACKVVVIKHVGRATSGSIPPPPIVAEWGSCALADKCPNGSCRAGRVSETSTFWKRPLDVDEE